MNGKNGKGENQSREKEEIGVAGWEIVRLKSVWVGVVVVVVGG